MHIQENMTKSPLYISENPKVSILQYLFFNYSLKSLVDKNKTTTSEISVYYQLDINHVAVSVY